MRSHHSLPWKCLILQGTLEGTFRQWQWQWWFFFHNFLLIVLAVTIFFVSKKVLSSCVTWGTSIAWVKNLQVFVEWARKWGIFGSQGKCAIYCIEISKHSHSTCWSTFWRINVTSVLLMLINQSFYEELYWTATEEVMQIPDNIISARKVKYLLNT